MLELVFLFWGDCTEQISMICVSPALFLLTCFFFQNPVALLCSLQFPHCLPSMFHVSSPAIVRVVLVRPGLQSQLWCCSLWFLCALGMACTFYTTVGYEKKTTSLVKHFLKDNLSSKSLQNHMLVQCCDCGLDFGFLKRVGVVQLLVCCKEAKSQETIYFGSLGTCT